MHEFQTFLLLLLTFSHLASGKSYARQPVEETGTEGRLLIGVERDDVHNQGWRNLSVSNPRRSEGNLIYIQLNL